MKYNFKNYQLEFIKQLTNIDASGDLDNDKEKKIYDAVEHEYIFSFTEDDMPTEKTLLSESILDLIKDTKKLKN